MPRRLSDEANLTHRVRQQNNRLAARLALGVWPEMAFRRVRGTSRAKKPRIQPQLLRDSWRLAACHRDGRSGNEEKILTLCGFRAFKWSSNAGAHVTSTNPKGATCNNYISRCSSFLARTDVPNCEFAVTSCSLKV